MFDESTEFITQQGVVATNVLCNPDDSTWVIVHHHFKDVPTAKAFMGLVNSDLFRKGDPIEKWAVTSRRHNPLQRDAAVGRIAAHVDLSYNSALMSAIVDAATFDSMKANFYRFTASAGQGVWIQNSGFFVR